MLTLARELVTVGRAPSWSPFGVCSRAARRPSDQLLTNSASWQSWKRVEKETANAYKRLPFNRLAEKAGDGIRTHDVQLGKDDRPSLRLARDATTKGCDLQGMLVFAAS